MEKGEILEAISLRFPRGLDKLIYSYFKEREEVFIEKWKPERKGQQTFDPYGIAVSDNEIYVTDLNSCQIQVFPLTGKFLNKDVKESVLREPIRKWGSEGKGDGQFKWPHGIAVSDDEVYVVDNGNCRIQVFTRKGESLAGRFLAERSSMEEDRNIENKFLRKWGSRGKRDGQFRDPRSIAISGDEIYIVEHGNHRVQVFLKGFEAQGPIRKWGTKGTDNGQFKYPEEIVISGDEIYVTDTWSDRIQVFAKGFEAQGFLRSYTLKPDECNCYGGIAIFEDEIYLVNSPNCENDQIQVFPKDPRFSSDSRVISNVVHGDIHGDNQFVGLEGITISKNRLYIADYEGHQIQVFEIQ